MLLVLVSLLVSYPTSVMGSVLHKDFTLKNMITLDVLDAQMNLSTMVITPAYAHACQTMCLAQHLPGVPHENFRLPKPKSRYPYLPNARFITREGGNDSRGWAIYTDGGIRGVGGVKLLLDGV